VSTITEVEGALASQRMSDAAEAIRRQEEEAHKAEIARIAAKQRGTRETGTPEAAGTGLP